MYCIISNRQMSATSFDLQQLCILDYAICHWLTSDYWEVLLDAIHNAQCMLIILYGTKLLVIECFGDNKLLQTQCSIVCEWCSNYQLSPYFRVQIARLLPIKHAILYRETDFKQLHHYVNGYIVQYNFLFCFH